MLCNAQVLSVHSSLSFTNGYTWVTDAPVKTKNYHYPRKVSRAPSPATSPDDQRPPPFSFLSS